MALREPRAWLVLALAGVFVALGLVFILAPTLGAALFGLPAPAGPSLSYLPAIGLRDVAFGLYLAILAGLADERAVGAVLGATLVIPVGDIVLVAAGRGLTAPGPLLLHAASGALMAGACLWLLRATSTRNGKD
jgi:hypothetical protein